MEPEELTRAWKPDRTLLQREPQRAGTADFALAADEQTVIGPINLRDPRLFPSEPAPAVPVGEEMLDDVADEEPAIEFVGSLIGYGDRARPASAWAGEEETVWCRPQRSAPSANESTGEFATGIAPGAEMVGAEPPKVIVAPAVLAGAAPDPARTEATKKRRRGRTADTKLGLGLCLLGVVALALSAAWRHPRTAPMTHSAFARALHAVASLRGK